MKPPFSYYGGKQRIASKIIPYIPKHTVYAEPFCGGATILFKKPWPDVTATKHYREYINDSNKEVINFFRQLRDNGEQLCRMLEIMPRSENEHAIAKSKNPNWTDLERAYYFFTNISQSFSNRLSAGWGREVFGDNLASKWTTKTYNLSDYLTRMKYVNIACQDALKFIEQYDSPQTFFYCDPPYPNTYQGHYKGYTINDFKNLVDKLKDIQGSAILSCYDVGIDMPPEWKRIEFRSFCAASSKGKVGSDRTRKSTNNELGKRERTEVIWVKQSIQPRPEIQKLYDSGRYDCFKNKSMERASV